MSRLRLSALFCSGVLAAATASAQETVVIRGATILPGGAPAIENGTLIVSGGVIQLIGDANVPVPNGAKVIDASGKFVTPGLIDANSGVGLNANDANEQAEEVTPAMRAIDALDRDDPRFARIRAMGVTSVYVSPGNRNVIGGLGAVVKTWGDTVDDMLVKADVGLRMTMGSEPSMGNRAIRGGTPNSIYYRRPTTRMGVVWAARKAFYDAKEYSERTVDPDNAAPPDAGMEVLVQALNGKVMVHTTARAEQDIRTALRLAKEFGYKTILDEPVEAWRVADEIAASGSPVLFRSPSMSRIAGMGGRDGAQVRWHTLNLLAERGVPFAIHTGGGNGSLPLIHEAVFATRHGLDRDKAMDAVTITPATILGVQDRVGSLAPGKDADMVLWTAHPLSPMARAEAVYVGGRLAN